MAATQKRRKYSKKRKANLRKYTNIRDVEEYIEDIARQEKTGLVALTVGSRVDYREYDSSK